MLRAYKFLLRPTVRQAQALTEMLRDHCSLYNGALRERRGAYRHSSKASITYGQRQWFGRHVVAGEDDVPLPPLTPWLKAPVVY